MKILALTDIHGAYAMAEEIIVAESPDVLIVGGDLTTIGTVKEAEDAVRRFQNICERVYCVAGNMDLPQHDELFERLGISLNGRAVQIDAVAFFGVSAAPHSALHTPYEISEEEIARRIRSGWNAVGHARIKVFVPHTPPYGTKLDIVHTGIHVGSTAVRNFIEGYKPEVVVCGHIHEARGVDSIGESCIVNCGTASCGYYAVIETGVGIKVTHRQRFPSGKNFAR